MFQSDNSNSEPSVQYVPRHYTLGENLGFDDSGECVPVCQPEVYREPEQEQDTPSMDPEQWVALVIAGARSKGEVGERILLMAYLDRNRIEGAPQNLRELASMLGCSHTAARAKLARVSAVFAREYAKLVSKHPIDRE